MALVLRQRHFIDAHKALTIFVVFALIAYYNRWGSYTAWAYLGMHGGYGLLWLLKSCIFPDKAWEAPVGIPYGLVIWFGLLLYWVAPYVITSQNVEAPAWVIGLAITTFTLGVFFHFASDMQKHVQLHLRPGKLITDGLFSHVRNMNYFGELLIYAGFSLPALHWFPYVALSLFVAFVWLPNMTKKEKSLSRYPEFAEYKKRSKMFIPWLY